MQVKTPSINAVPDEAVIFIDRRMTFGETKEQVMAHKAAIDRFLDRLVGRYRRAAKRAK